MGVVVAAWGLFQILQLLARIAVIHASGGLLLYYSTLIVVHSVLVAAGRGVAKGNRLAIFSATAILLALAMISLSQGSRPAVPVLVDLSLATLVYLFARDY